MAEADKKLDDQIEDLQDMSQLSSDVDETVPPSTDADSPEGQVAETDNPGGNKAAGPVHSDKVVVGGRNWFQKRWDWYRIHKHWAIPLTILLLIGVILGVPQTRYPVLGLGLKQNFQVVVLDAKTGKPVTAAVVTAGDTRAVTDNKGRATIKTKVGNRQFTVIKKYYRNASTTILVPISQKGGPQRLVVTATGRQVPVNVINKLTGKPLANAVVAASGTETKTDKDGKAVLVLPADKRKVAATVKAEGYNTSQAEVTVTDLAVKENNFALTPGGKVYFLSKLSGKVDVVKTNLDGTGREVVLAGTGNEDNSDTVLLASRDWKYLALKSKRDGGEHAKLFLIDTATEKLTVMDEGNANFTQIGWSGEYFVYSVYRNSYNNWQPSAASLKSYNARSAKIAALDSTNATGASNFDAKYETFSPAYILRDEVVYSKLWYAYPGYINVAGQQNTLVSVAPDGSKKTTIAKYEANEAYFDALQVYEPNELITRVLSARTNADKYFEYGNGKFTPRTDIKYETFNKEYPTYLVSPGGKAVFWSEPRDGKNVLMTGDANAGAAKQIASLSEYAAYGWYGDDYLLLSKNASELYVMPAAGGTPIKITDYHRPGGSFRGYGYGYGGL